MSETAVELNYQNPISFIIFRVSAAHLAGGAERFAPAGPAFGSPMEDGCLQ